MSEKKIVRNSIAVLLVTVLLASVANAISQESPSVSTMPRTITTRRDVNTTEKMIIEDGYHQLSSEELEQRIVGKTVRGDYYNGRTYVSYADSDGTIEGINDLGSHITGTWSINKEDNTFTVEWDGYWDNWTGRVYDVQGKIQFYDSTTFLWRTTFNSIDDAQPPLRF